MKKMKRMKRMARKAIFTFTTAFMLTGLTTVAEQVVPTTRSELSAQRGTSTLTILFVLRFCKSDACVTKICCIKNTAFT